MDAKTADTQLREQLRALSVDLDRPKHAVLPIIGALETYYQVQRNALMRAAAVRLLCELDGKTIDNLTGRDTR